MLLLPPICMEVCHTQQPGCQLSKLANAKCNVLRLEPAAPPKSRLKSAGARTRPQRNVTLDQARNNLSATPFPREPGATAKLSRTRLTFDGLTTEAIPSRLCQKLVCGHYRPCRALLEADRAHSLGRTWLATTSDSW